MENAIVRSQGETNLSVFTDTTYASDQDVKETFDARWANNTHRSYRSQWREFTKWCEQYGHNALPATPETVVRYLISRSVSGKRMSTLRTAVSTIAAAHKGSNLDNPCATEAVRAAIAGRNRLDGRSAKQKRPLDENVVNEVVKYLREPRKKNWGRKESPDDINKRSKVDEALILLMQYCALRRSEVVELEWDDYMEEVDGSGLLTIRKSKTDQTSEGYIVYVNKRTAKALASIKSDTSYGKMFNMTPETINNRIKAAVEAAGYNPADYGGHSGRVGFAVMLTQKQAPTSEVMRMGRWRSHAMVAKYTRGIEAAASARWLE